jgi:hypothetical protein
MSHGCFNRAAYATHTKVQDGWYDTRGEIGKLTRSPDLRHVPFRMATDCQYTHTDLGQADKRCDGCKHQSTTKETQ